MVTELIFKISLNKRVTSYLLRKREQNGEQTVHADGKHQCQNVHLHIGTIGKQPEAGHQRDCGAGDRQCGGQSDQREFGHAVVDGQGQDEQKAAGGPELAIEF
jgi:hypothetical protein